MPMHDISPEAGFLIGLLIGLVLYGLYCTLFTLTLYTRRRCDSKNHLITGAIIGLFIMCTIVISLHLAICYHLLIQSPVKSPTAVPQGWYPVRDVLLLCSNVVAESLLIWRLYIVWSENWKVLIVPAIAMMIVVSSGAVNIVATFIICLSSVQRGRQFILVLSRSLPIGWFAALVNNLFCTILIVWKLWCIARTAEGRATARLVNPAVSALIESGALYTGTLLCMGILWGAKLDGVSAIIATPLVVVIGIASTSIILRLNLVGAQKQSVSIQNDASLVQSAPSGEILGDLGRHNKSRVMYSEIGIETTPEAEFVRPMSEFSCMSGDPSAYLSTGFQKEAMYVDKRPNSLAA